MLTRYSFPRLVKLPYQHLPILAIAHHVDNFAGHDTITCYITWLRLRRILAF